MIYYIEAFQKKSALKSLITSNDPDNSTGEKAMIDDRWVNVQELRCAEKHYVNIYHSHYTYVESEYQLFGPAEEPDVHCPNPQCKARFGPHEDHIFRLDKSPNMQYVLRTTSLKEPPNFKLQEAITRENASSFDQISVSHRCRNCNKLVYFNYSPRNIDPSETYEGVKKVH